MVQGSESTCQGRGHGLSSGLEVPSCPGATKPACHNYCSPSWSPQHENPKGKPADGNQKAREDYRGPANKGTNTDLKKGKQGPHFKIRMKRQRVAGESGGAESRAGQNRESQRLRELAGAERHSGTAERSPVGRGRP